MQEKVTWVARFCVLHLVMFLAEYGTWISFVSVPAGKGMTHLNSHEV
jgi:hypothetical protein